MKKLNLKTLYFCRCRHSYEAGFVWSQSMFCIKIYYEKSLSWLEFIFSQIRQIVPYFSIFDSFTSVADCVELLSSHIWRTRATNQLMQPIKSLLWSQSSLYYRRISTDQPTNALLWRQVIEFTLLKLIFFALEAYFSLLYFIFYRHNLLKVWEWNLKSQSHFNDTPWLLWRKAGQMKHC